MKPDWKGLTVFDPKPEYGLLDKFVAELVHWNKTIRLVGPSEEKGIAVQIVDSLLPFRYAQPAFPLLDIGSGAGLPAIPLATIYKEGEIVCVESRGKRVTFIRHAARTLGLKKVTAVNARAEEAIEANPALRKHFSCVTARAVADVPTLLALAEPYLAPGGKVILGRGGEAPVEIGGWTIEKHVKYTGPTDSGDRSVIVFTKS